LIEKSSFPKKDNFVFSNAQDRFISINSTSRQLGWQDWEQIWNEINLKMFCHL